METELTALDACDPRQCIASKIMKANRLINNVFRKHLSQFDITNSQMSMLFVLYKRGKLRQSELGKTLYLEKSTVNRNIRKLLESGYAEKTENSTVSITPQGAELMNRIVPHWENAMTEIRTQLQEPGETALNTLLNNLIPHA